MTEPSKAVFLSYASQDAEAARRICETLRAAGIEVWFDQSELRGGDVWDQQIRKQIKACALFIPVISANAHAREEGYFRLEWKLAVDRSHLMAGTKTFLLPVAIDDTSQSDERIPDRFRELQWSRLPAGDTPPNFVERVSRLLSHEESPASGQTDSSHGPQPSTSPIAREGTPKPGTSRRSRAALLLIAAVVVLAVGCFTVDKLWLSKRATPAAGSVPVQSAATAPSAFPEKSIAVLPFVDLSEKKDQEYFADGMAEEILDVLTKIPGLQVIGRTSSFQFKGKNEDLRRIGIELGAARLVEGSVRRSADHVRVTAQLIRSADGAHEWSETYDRSVSDVLTMQQEIAVSIARALQVTVEARSDSEPRVKNPEAYDLFLRGLQADDRFDKAALEQAANYFQQAIRLDPSFTRAADHLALTQFWQADGGFAPLQFGFERARASAKNLLKSDPRSLYGHALMSRIHADYDWDWVNAKREADATIAIDPRFWYGLFAAAMVEGILGQWDEAERAFRAALNVDPLSPDTHQALGFILYRAGHFAEAAAEHRRSLEISPSDGTVHYQLAGDLLALGQPDAARREIQLEPQDSYKWGGLAVVYHALGRKADSDAALKNLTREYSDHSPYLIAVVHASRGESDQAFEWLDRAYRLRDFDLTYIKGDWLLRSLLSDPRYKAFLRKMNLPE